MAFDGVSQARVYGRKNPITGALVAADVVPGPSLDLGGLKDHLVRTLDRYKVPVVIRKVESLAVSESGKLAR